MVSAIKQYGTVGELGKIEFSTDLPQGTKVEIVVLIEEEDETEYLLQSEANRQHLIEGINNIANKINLVTISAKEWNEKYCF